GCTRDRTFNQQQVALSVNTYYVQALNSYTFVAQLTCHFLAFDTFPRILFRPIRTGKAGGQEVPVGSFVVTKVQRFTVPSKPFPLPSDPSFSFPWTLCPESGSDR